MLVIYLLLFLELHDVEKIAEFYILLLDESLQKIAGEQHDNTTGLEMF